jgi:alpha-mannosidase
VVFAGKAIQTRNTMKRVTGLLLLLAMITNCALSQESSVQYLQGFDKALSGFTLNYHSPLPDVGSCLLSRAQSDYQPIEWLTEVVPMDYKEDVASFIWMYGIDTDVDGYSFALNANGQECLEFKSPASNEKLIWIVEGRGGSSLTFYQTMVDKYKDQMGFAVLKLPRSYFKTGEPVKIRIIGEKAKNNRWYMTFKCGIANDLKIVQENVVQKEKGELFHLVRFDFTHIGSSILAGIHIEDRKHQIILNPGYNSIHIKLPKTDHEKEYQASIKIGEQETVLYSFSVKPVKEWTVYMVQHSHTDIGYTRSQTEILPEHLRYIDYALDFCDQTETYPENAKFHWTCESSWVVREYLKNRPQEQIDRLLKRIGDGQIEVTGMFFNYSEIVDEAGLAAQTKYLKPIIDLGIPVKTAMQNDVNGIGWCLVDYFQGTGVKYVIMGQHGHRARIPFDQPTPFWWESPSGNRLLAYRSEHYMKGNELGLISGDIDLFRSSLAGYLNQLEKKSYPFSRTAFQFSGYITDNAPPSTIACDMVKAWNEMYEWPKLELAVASQFMEYLEVNHADELSVKKVAWPDWWTDGAGSALQETKASRITHTEMIANSGLLAMASMLGADFSESWYNDYAQIMDALLFYDEHTYGAAESISDPMIENSVIQWNEKSAYVWDAFKRSRMFREKSMGFIQPFVEKSEVPSIAVFNTLNWSRSGLMTVYIDHEILPVDKAFRIIDYEGNEIPAQPMESRTDGTYWSLWVKDIPSMGYKIYKILREEKPPLPIEKKAFDGIIENEFYKITFNEESGLITSLFDKSLNLELLDGEADNKMGQFIYETLENRHQMERFTYNKIDTSFQQLLGNRTRLEHLDFVSMNQGPIWQSVFFQGDLAECASDPGISIEVRLYNQEKRIELKYGMRKIAHTTPEAVYVSFPFQLDDGKLFYEAQGGMVNPGINQLEGTSSDWNAIQNFVSVRSDKAQIIFGSHEIPLVQFGEINTGRYYYQHQPKSNHIYSWVLNNYWTTNFKASQEGEMKWNYMISSTADASNSMASRLSWGYRIPFLSRVLPAGDSEAKTTSLSLIKDLNKNLLLINAQPAMDNSGIVLQIRETEGKKAVIKLTDLLPAGYTKAELVNVLEDAIYGISDEIVVDPFGSVFIKILR